RCSAPTGGRGVLHQGDLTYAIVVSEPAGNREEVYRFLCQFLLEGWRQLGVDLSFGGEKRPDGRSHHCFGLATAADLVTATGQKLVGSAQLRRGRAILQHGSMRLAPAPELYERVFQTPAPPPLQPQGQPLPTMPDIVEQLTQAAARCFGCQFNPQPLTPWEWQSVTARIDLSNNCQNKG
ncbi:MAG: lipoate--protein ligase family protein, partial [Leptolyngbyaceae cyanobacterium SM2_5_2]|nr:lipoate--protein ligase family protein [Leptolyngbyaceae cyanobacterium SM2_5_2]